MKSRIQIKLVIGTLLTLLVLIAVSSHSQQASADAAPPAPPSGSDIYPSIGNTMVRMVSEYVLIDIAGYSSEPNGHAKVTATFNMENLGEELEIMQVRFPMFHSEWSMSFEEMHKQEWCEYNYQTNKPLLEVNIKINEISVPTEITYKTFLDYMHSPNEDGEAIYITVPCWAYFEVDFPPAETVIIQVSYIISGYRVYGTVEETQFPYILKTGAAWFDTIGKAEIVARLPYEVTDINFFDCSPDCKISDYEISWSFEDFEPDEDIKLTIINPEIWNHILDEQKLVKQNPDNGEAWGRLGKAYKEILFGRKGILYASSPPYDQIFSLSQEAYQNATNLLSNDADWHYGYSELLCQYSFWNNGNASDWIDCAFELHSTLKLNSGHIKAFELVEELERERHWTNLDFQILELVEGKPDFLILTSMPTDKPTRTAFPPATEPNTPLPPTSTAASTEPLPPTNPPPTSTAAVEPTSTDAPITVPTSLPTEIQVEEPTSLSGTLFILGGLLLGVAALGYYLFRRKNA